MAFDIGSYTDPGVYIQEQVVPGSVSLSTVPLTVCLIGVAKRDKRVNNEAEVRGAVSDETLTVSSTPSAHYATLANISDRKSANTVVYKDGVALDSSHVSFLPASIVGPTLTTLNFTTNNKISLAMDGKQAVTIAITSGADATTITGSLITQALASIDGTPAIGALTADVIAEGINKALNGATSLGYGPAYASVAVAASNIITLTSPLSTSASDIRLYQAFPSAHSQTVAVFGGSVPRQASSIVNIDNASYDSLSVYTADYVATNTDVDTLVNANVQSVVRVGSFASVTSFRANQDFSLSGDTLDWSIDAAAVFTSSVAAATHDISTNDTIVLSLDGKSAVTIDLNGMASPPPGYANPSSAAAATPAEITNNINAVLAASASYGPLYRNVATVSGGGSSSKLVLTSPTEGTGSYVQLAAPTSLSAVTALFGLTTGQLPYSANGTGSRPAAGAVYFATYEYTRPTNDYNKAKRFFTPDSLYSDVGFQTSTNQLAMAGGIAFDNKAPSVMVVQVNDSIFNGSPSQSEIQAALTAAAATSVATDVIVLDTRLAVQVDLFNHVINSSSPTEKAYRRGWFGMARGTLVGDRDTPDTFIYRATRTLQVPADSAGRGRMILVAPSEATRTIVKEDGSEEDVDLDGTYLAVAIAAKMTSFSSPADTLLRKTISGFVTDGFTEYLKFERGLLASNGVTVVTLDAGRLVLLDPITTEAGGGRLPSFQEISASTQKDATSLAVTQMVDANLVGVVPSDLARFIVTIKGYIGSALRSLISSGSIAPYKDDASGVTRDLDLSKDIQVFQDSTDPTKYRFRYTYNLRYPAKRFFGEYSVDRSAF